MLKVEVYKHNFQINSNKEVNRIMGKKKKEEILSPNFIVYQGASAALPTMMDEYSKERERAGILDNKATFLITILIALLTVYIPILSSRVTDITYSGCSKIAFAAIVVAIMILFFSLILAAVLFYKLIMIIKPEEYRKVDVNLVCKEDYLKCDSDTMDKALCEHYKELILHNSNINDRKAKALSNCFILMACLFFLLLMSAIIMNSIQF